MIATVTFSNAMRPVPSAPPVSQRRWREFLLTANESLRGGADGSEVATGTGGIFGSPKTSRPAAQLRSDSKLIRGVAVPWEQMSEWKLSKKYGRVRWLFRPGAFTRTLASGRKISLLFDHGADRSFAATRVLSGPRNFGSTRDGHLRIFETLAGLQIEVDTSHALGERFRQFVQVHPDWCKNLSIGFRAVKFEAVDLGTGTTLMNVDDAELDEVSITPAGAFRQTFLV